MAEPCGPRSLYPSQCAHPVVALEQRFSKVRCRDCGVDIHVTPFVPLPADVEEWKRVYRQTWGEEPPRWEP